MQKIVPHLWYDTEAGEAALFYTGLFPDSKPIKTTVIENTPSGNTETVKFQLAGQPFLAISAGPYFKFNPSVSLMVMCTSVEEADALWNAFMEGGTALMPIGEYPFSGRYGWVQDRYGLSWQIMLVEPERARQKIVPNLLFSGAANGSAEEAVTEYAQIFNPSEIGLISRYGEKEADAPAAKINYTYFSLCGTNFSAMDNAAIVDYTFNEAFSLLVYCDDQAEIDFYWDKLSAVPEAEQCGWLKDRFGVSWQIVPTLLDDIMQNGSWEERARATEAFLKMKKFDIEALEKARRGTL
jgi:predicted 3-demethylubiquinone-9 3-methyltransferase (glyoxalase superfamily)